MYRETSSSDESHSSENSRKSRKRKNTKKVVKQDSTWAEAAEIVLSKYDHPLPHKEILKLIEESNLKCVGRGTSAPLAVLNSMLNSNCKGPDAVFYRASSGSACFGLTKNLEKAHTSNKITSVEDKSIMKLNSKMKMKQKLTPPGSFNIAANRSLKPPTAQQLPRKQLIPPGSSRSGGKITVPISQAAYERLKQHPQHRRMGPTTSALVRPAPPCSRPPPGAALRVMPPKKRVKLDDDTDSDKDSEKSEGNKSDSGKTEKPRVTPKSTGKPVAVNMIGDLPQRRESQRNLNRNILKANIAPNTVQINQKVINKDLPKQASTINKPVFQIRHNNKLQSVPTLKKTISKKSNTESDSSSVHSGETKQPTFLGVKFKRMKKANIADQIKRSKEGKLDLMTPDSFLTSVQIKDMLNERMFQKLPAAYQYQLLMLLPDVDRQVGEDGALRLKMNALNNAFFNRSCQEFKDKLMDGEFNSDIIQRAKNEINWHEKLDPWKMKFFEPTYGVSSLDDPTIKEPPPPNLKPVESSWKVFLKFAENSTDDFEEALSKIQANAQQKAEEERNRKQMKEKQSKARVKPPVFNCSPKSTNKRLAVSPHARPGLSIRSPVSLKPKVIGRMEASSKEKSRRALKRAQQLQRKKAFDKQLKDAKAKLVQEARSSAVRKEESILKDISKKTIASVSEKDSKKFTYAFDDAADRMKNVIQHLDMQDLIEASTQDATNDSVIDLCDSNALKNLINKASDSKKPNVKRKTIKSNNSRIAIGPSTFSSIPGSGCPCNLKAMEMCQLCGYMLHGDCMKNGEKICISCAS